MTFVQFPATQRSRGMRDWLPADMRAFRRVEDAFRGAASRWGYQEIRTPTIETYSLFTAAGGLSPQMLSRVYSFLDWDGWSGERVVLRPDSTIPVARAAAEAELPVPARLFYVQNVFRFSPSGEDREDWQCGIEYLGAPPPVGDVEVAAIACEILDHLGLQPEVRLAHVGITRAVIDLVARDEEDARRWLDAAAAEGLAAIRPVNGQGQLAAFIEVATRPRGSLPLLQNLQAIAATCLPAALPALQELASVAGALAAAGRPVEIDLAMPRDFEYYSGVVFEFASGGESWGGGGRYTPSAPGSPATACGLGLEAARLAAHVSASTRPPLVVTIVPANSDDLGRALAVARALHRSHIPAALELAPGLSQVSVTVHGERLVARTPAGERELRQLDELVTLLIQQK
jgi:histidyl-tRNA synthetase